MSSERRLGACLTLIGVIFTSVWLENWSSGNAANTTLFHAFRYIEVAFASPHAGTPWSEVLYDILCKKVLAHNCEMAGLCDKKLTR
jgi:hypothetical protein